MSDQTLRDNTLTLVTPLYRFLVNDHTRLARLLDHASRPKKEIDGVIYAEFRRGLLRHIAMEEKVLLPAAKKFNGGNPLAIASKLRLDHGALTALLAPSPTQAIIEAIRAILEAHNPLEEDSGGLYETCEKLAGNKVETLLARLQSVPEVQVAVYRDGPNVMESVRRVLRRSGYEAIASKLSDPPSEA